MAIPAFPGAEGAGGYANGGRGGDVYHVTNLNATGAGSLTEGLSTAPTAGRTIVFDVSGYITSPAEYKLTKSNITIAGQTAPGDGVGLRNGTFWISGDDVVVRHFRFYGHRGGDALDYDSGSNNSILDHVTVAFGPDENLSTWSPPENMTFQDSINAWGLVSHSAGGLWNTNHSTALRTLWIHNHTRNPKARPDGVLDWVNNVVADWDIGFIMGDSSSPASWQANVRGSYFVASYAKTTALEKALLDRNGNPNFNLYLNDSHLDGNANGVLDVSKSGYSIASGNYVQRPTPYANTGVPVTVDDYLTGYKKVVSTSGPLRLDATSSIGLRDELNAIAVNDLVTQARRQVSNVSQTGASNGGWGTLNSAPAPVDSDRDGMPDFWENTLGLNAAVQDHNGALASSGGIVTGASFMPPNTPAGYTNLEEYLHFLATPHGTVARNTTTDPTAIDIDLRRYAMGFLNGAQFVLSNVSGGAATLLGDGHTVRFVPTVNTAGRAKFNFKVTDAQGSTWTQQFNLLVSAQGSPKNLLWKGGANPPNVWDDQTNNWLKNGNGPGIAFSPGDSVLFDDSSSVTNIDVTGPRGVSGMTVNASKDYTFGGVGSIGGPGALQKAGSGTLTLNGAHTYSGGTIVDGGALVVNTAGGAGSGAIKLNGVGLTLAAGNYGNLITFTGNNTVNTTGGNVQLDSLSGAGTFNLVTPHTVTLVGSTSGFTGTLAMAGSAGFVRFNGATGSAAATFDLGGGAANITSRNGNVTLALGALLGGVNTALNGATSAGNLTTYSIGGANLTTTYAGRILNGGYADSTADITALTKVGVGRLVLTNTGNAYTGATAINAGMLEVNGALGNTAVTVASSAALVGSGIVGSATGGAVTVQTGGKIAPGAGGGGGRGNLRIGNGLTLATGSNLAFDLSSSPAGNNDKITLNGGTMSLTGTINFAINFADGFLSPGTYVLVEGGAATAASGATLNYAVPSGTRQTYALQRSAAGAGPATISLVVTGAPSANLVWRPGVGNSAWDLNTTANWHNNSVTDTFFNLDGVTFDDTAAAGAGGAAGLVTLAAGSVQPRAVTVNNGTLAYSIGGAGTIDGTGALTKSGSGLLTLNTAGVNTYSGGTFLNGGTIQLGNDAANSGALGSGPITMGNGTTLKMFDSSGGSAQFANWNLVVPGGVTATVWQDSRSQISGSLTGSGTLNLREAFVRNDILLDAANFTGRINVTTDADGGDFRFGTSYAYAGFPKSVVSLANSVAAYYVGIVAEGAGTTVDFGELSGAATSVLMGAATGGRSFAYRIGGLNSDSTFSGTIREQSATTITSLIKTGAGTWTIAGDASYAGTTTVEAGTLRVTGSLTSGGGSFIVKAGATLDLGGGTVTADSIQVEPGGRIIGAGTIVGDVINDGVVALGAAGQSLHVSGEVQNRGQMTIDGAHVRLGGLTVVGGANTQLAATGDVILDVVSLTVDGDAALDLKNNKLVVRNPAAPGTGVWTGSAYTGIHALIRAGFNDGAWDGRGLRTTADPNSSLTTLGVASAADILGLGAGESGDWNGVGVDALSTLVMYTHSGDANLDGYVDGGDYAYIDAFVNATGSDVSYLHGDFNYDGFVDGGDYAYIDVTVGSPPIG